MRDIATEVRNIISKELSIPSYNIADAALIKEDLAADSLDAIDLTLTLEKKFNIEIPDDVAEKLLTVRQLIDYITSKITQTEESAHGKA